MDIRCPVCAEPWDTDCLHEEITARWPDAPWRTGGRTDQSAYDTYYTKVRQDFARRGCEAIESYGTGHNLNTMNSPAAARSATLFAVLGDDVDGIASLTHDLDRDTNRPDQ